MAAVITSPSWTQAAIPPEPVRRFTIDEYHLMIEAGVLTEDDNVELLDGYLVEKMPKNPRHTAILSLIQSILSRLIPDGYHLSVQNPITTETSEPEPDLMILRGAPLDYLAAHPRPSDAALVVAIADSSLQRDRTTKMRIFAASGVAVYWIVNLQENQIEEYTGPSLSADMSDYDHRHTYRADDTIPVILDGHEIASLRAGDLLPQA